MYITFKDKKIQKICEQFSKAQKKFGAQCTKILARRLKQLEAANDLAVYRTLPGHRLHKLNGNRSGQYAIDLEQPYRLVLVPLYEDEVEEEKFVKGIKIIEIHLDYH